MQGFKKTIDELILSSCWQTEQMLVLACFLVLHPEIIKLLREKADLTYSARSFVPD